MIIHELVGFCVVESMKRTFLNPWLRTIEIVSPEAQYSLFPEQPSGIVKVK